MNENAVSLPFFKDNLSLPVLIYALVIAVIRAAVIPKKLYFCVTITSEHYLNLNGYKLLCGLFLSAARPLSYEIISILNLSVISVGGSRLFMHISMRTRVGCLAIYNSLTVSRFFGHCV